MTYFLEFHTPRGLFTSKPCAKEQMENVQKSFISICDGERGGNFVVGSSIGDFILTTEIIRQTVLVIREAE